MYVLEVTGSAAVTGINKAANQEVQVPADRCTWITVDGSGSAGYNITQAHFYNGAVAAGVPLTGSNLAVRLGYVGKSGRFVPITD